MSDWKKKRSGKAKQRGSRLATSTQKIAADPDAIWDEHLVLSFKALADPTPEEMAQAIELVERLSAARVSRARPGMLRIDVLGKEKENVRAALQSLEDWDVSDEGRASMPIEPPFSG